MRIYDTIKIQTLAVALHIPCLHDTYAQGELFIDPPISDRPIDCFEDVRNFGKDLVLCSLYGKTNAPAIAVQAAPRWSKSSKGPTRNPKSAQKEQKNVQRNRTEQKHKPCTYSICICTYSHIITFVYYRLPPLPPTSGTRLTEFQLIRAACCLRWVVFSPYGDHRGLHSTGLGLTWVT